ncbi:GNAT family N-acetyltransferase [Streptomyces fuscigenes]|uniref:GNAT family N-acetyltransferase n=1 Tax=Streptomyces fuscigenes TaxID=1528880 RepID=UPI001F3DB98B|nr:GNAT family N-acetyltransferase [Streptomyces fuscigenes]MCF3961386.1 GNAT family N-acetyltransferase [Streptomyces fuscigenes]
MTELRVLHKDHWDRWYGQLMRAFGGEGEPREERELWDALTELDRSLGLWDGRECVGTAGAFSFRLSVPGGALVAAAGVTMVTVAATHRRRGLLRSMMRAQLDDVRERGEPLAALTASEPDIYGRFGYGCATRRLSLEIDTTRVRIAPPPGTDEVAVRYASPAEPAVGRRIEEVYARAVAGRPGMLARQPGWERLPLLDPPGDRGGASPLQCVLAERGGRVAGFALFHTTGDSDAAGANGVVRVREVYGDDPASYAALWRFLCEIDLMWTVTAKRRPVDDPVLHLLSDVRRSGLRLRDDLYLRPVDVGSALSARTYRTPLDVVLEVADDFCPWNAGRVRLSGDAGGAVCEATADAPDLALSVRELGAAYLGGTTLRELADAGRVRELRPGALAAASTAFSGEPAPWLPHGF